MERTVYTVGHSNQTIDLFLACLRLHKITAIADVRSYPYSSINPQFDKESLATELQSNGIAYVFLGKELGARTGDPACYVAGKVQYDLLAQTALFREGLKRVLVGMDKFRVALMCAEAEPLACHRTILVARQLCEASISVKHILKNSQIEDHGRSMDRLLRMLNMNNHDIFRDQAALLSEAYRRQAERIAYVPASKEEKQVKTALRGR